MDLQLTNDTSDGNDVEMGSTHSSVPGDDAETDVDTEGQADQDAESNWGNTDEEVDEAGQTMQDGQPKERGTKWYDERKSAALFPGCKMMVLQVAYALLSLKLRFHVTDIAMDALCALLAYALCPDGSCMPHNMYAVRKLCQVESSTGITYHCCEDGHHIWDYVPRNEWSKHHYDICTVENCGKRRFV